MHERVLLEGDRFMSGQGYDPEAADDSPAEASDHEPPRLAVDLAPGPQRSKLVGRRHVRAVESEQLPLLVGLQSHPSDHPELQRHTGVAQSSNHRSIPWSIRESSSGHPPRFNPRGQATPRAGPSATSFAATTRPSSCNSRWLEPS